MVNDVKVYQVKRRFDLSIDVLDLRAGIYEGTFFVKVALHKGIAVGCVKHPSAVDVLLLIVHICVGCSYPKWR